MTHYDPSSASFFERKYLDDPDPWRFETDNYERSRYALILDALPKRRYHVAFEPGCSIGILTEALAARCGKLYAFDFSPTAVAACQLRCASLSNVVIECRALDSNVSLNGSDLVVLSEIGYYFTVSQWDEIVDKIVSQMPRGGTLLAAHWLGISPDHILSGDQVHQGLMKQKNLKHELGRRLTGFRLDRWVVNR